MSVSPYTSWLSKVSESDVLTSALGPGSVVTVDMGGCIRLWETGLETLQRSLIEWRNMIGMEEGSPLQVIPHYIWSNIAKRKDGSRQFACLPLGGSASSKTIFKKLKMLVFCTLFSSVTQSQQTWTFTKSLDTGVTLIQFPKISQTGLEQMVLSMLWGKIEKNKIGILNIEMFDGFQALKQYSIQGLIKAQNYQKCFQLS